jgi:glucose/arabinose dehydrogenase
MRLYVPLALAVLVTGAGANLAGPAPQKLSWGQPWPDEDPELPDGFSDSLVATGLTGATALAVAPDGRVFVCEQVGALRVVKDDRLLPTPFLTVAVDSYWERGLIGVTLDPDFPRRPYVYVCYVAAKPYTHHRVSRFTAAGDVAEPGSEVVLLEGDDQSKLGGFQPGGHQGGALHFGKDGKLYVAIGDQTAGSPAQRLDTFQGKLLRINPDGSIPDDNPFVRRTTGKYRAIWALGLRNVFTFAVQPGTGRMLLNDVGLTRIEEINEGVAGANYGWPESEGPTTNPKHRNPLYGYDRNVGRSISGATFYNPPVRQFPERYVGKFFFADFMDGWIRVLDPDRPAEAEVFATGLVGAVDLATAPDGSLYYLNRRAWTIDPKFQPGTGTLHRVRYGVAGTPVPQVTRQPAAELLAEGQPAELRVAAAGEAPLTYRWLRDGRPVPGADGPGLTVPAAAAADDGAVYQCVVANRHGTTRSRRATLRVLPLQHPDDSRGTAAGLDYECFAGPGPMLPDIANQHPVATGHVADVRRLTPTPGNFVHLRGYLSAPADGAYTFFLPAGGPAKL